MKKFLILAFLLLGICSARSQTIIRYKYMCSNIPANSWYSVAIPCEPYYCSGDKTIILNVNFNLVPPGGTIGPNPYRMEFEVYDANMTIIATANMDAPTSAFSPTWYFPHGSITPGPIKAKVFLQKFNVFGWVNVGTYWSGTLTQDACPPPTCWQLQPPTISGTYTTTLTESSAWINTSGTTVIPGGANVALDAHSSSYVALNPGFETQDNSVFVAEALNGCSPGAPAFMIILPPGGPVEVPIDNPNQRSMAIENAEEQFVVYPNPTDGWLTVQHPEGLTNLQVFDVMGKLVLTIPVDGGRETRIDLSEQPKGIYLLMAAGQPTQQLVKL